MSWERSTRIYYTWMAYKLGCKWESPGRLVNNTDPQDTP